MRRAARIRGFAVRTTDQFDLVVNLQTARAHRGAAMLLAIGEEELE
jgi:hypothetical protein